MIQGSTQRLRFELPFDANKTKTLKVVFTQRGKDVITKHKKDCSIAQNVIVCWLDADETAKFRPEMAYAQIEAEMESGSGAWVSSPYKLPVFNMISEGEE